ncbi:MAG: ParA family protein [Geminicoccaceae bacterium]|nr:ParA family protein [Geminicoccaceae bacterium]MCS7268079.1 ParA family protein [Geminicoccaceae bacterium]MDW8125979.1 ParA family protein [Geminicoccaceae bacterium]MDW8342335.1 ParA family protein [Geminicoccaceae bacterium]
MQVLAICSQKGGSGKTTLCGHLAVQAHRIGDGPVVLLDCDPQGSLAAWWNARALPGPEFARTTLASLDDDVARLRARGFRYLFVDTPPAASAAIARVMRLSDLILVPTRPSPHDLRAVGATLDLAERAQRPLVFVVNGATARSRLTSDAAVALSQHGTVAPVLVSQKVVMASSMIDGRTVMETHPESPSAREIEALWLYLRERLARLANREAFLRRRIPVGGFGRRRIEGEAAESADELGEVT